MMHRVPALLLAFAAAFPLLVSMHSNVSAQQTSLSDVLARAAEYVTAFADPSRVILCEERYEHTFVRLMINMAGSVERLPQGSHNWVAEMATVATPDDEKSGFPWLEF
jgi:hypothetical protein